MRTYIIIIITSIYTLSLYSQTKTESTLGQVYKIQGLITDKTTKDTLHLTIVELMNKNHKLIKAKRADFDGLYLSSICSNELIDDTLLIKTTHTHYKQEIFYYQINSDSVINIEMSIDQHQAISKNEFQKYNQKFQNSKKCGLIEPEINNEESYYQHYCSGEKRKYKTLIEANENLLEWILISD